MSLILAERHIAAEKSLRDHLSALVERVWRALPAHNRENVDQFLSLVVPAVLAVQRQSAALTEAFLTASLGVPAQGIDPDLVTGPAVRNGTPTEEVYMRPFVQLWSGLGDGKMFEDAYDDSLSRLQATAEMDPQLSMRAAAREVMEAEPSIVGYRRVTDGDACPLCLIASTQRYRKADLLPIHNRCGCSVLPIIGTEDPGQVIDRELLNQLKRDGEINKITAQRQAARARKASGAEPAVKEHGELGPVLVDADHDFSLLR